MLTLDRPVLPCSPPLSPVPCPCPGQALHVLRSRELPVPEVLALLQGRTDGVRWQYLHHLVYSPPSSSGAGGTGGAGGAAGSSGSSSHSHPHPGAPPEASGDGVVGAAPLHTELALELVDCVLGLQQAAAAALAAADASNPAGQQQQAGASPFRTSSAQQAAAAPLVLLPGLPAVPSLDSVAAGTGGSLGHDAPRPGPAHTLLPGGASPLSKPHTHTQASLGGPQRPSTPGAGAAGGGGSSGAMSPQGSSALLGGSQRLVGGNAASAAGGAHAAGSSSAAAAGGVAGVGPQGAGGGSSSMSLPATAANLPWLITIGAVLAAGAGAGANSGGHGGGGGSSGAAAAVTAGQRRVGSGSSSSGHNHGLPTGGSLAILRALCCGGAPGGGRDLQVGCGWAAAAGKRICGSRGLQ